MQPPKRRVNGVIEAALFSSNPLAYTRRQVARYGPVFRSHFLRHSTLTLAAEEAHRAVLVDQVSNFPWGYHRFGVDLFGQGLIILNGPEHDHHRKLMQPAMHRDHFAGYLVAMQTALETLFARWGEAGTVPDMHAQLRDVTFAMSTSILVGMGPGTDQQRLHRLFAQMQQGTLTPLRRNIPGTAWGRALHARAQLDAALLAFITERRAQTHDDALGSLIAAQDEGGCR